MRRSSCSFVASSCTTQLPRSSWFSATTTSRIIRTDTISVKFHSKTGYSSFSHVVKGCSAHNRGSANHVASTLPSSSSKRQTVAVLRPSTNIIIVKNYTPSSFFSRGKAHRKLPFSYPHRVLIPPPPKCHYYLLQKNLVHYGSSSGSYVGTPSRFFSLAD